MRSYREVSPEKLRGGYYTPAPLVDFCLRRAVQSLDAANGLKVLEPSAGDGAFIRGLARAREQLPAAIDVHAIELVPEEAAKAEISLGSTGLDGRVVQGSVLAWAAEARERFGLVVGNPPFVRYQFVADEDKAAISRLGERLGVRFGGVANLWIPVVLSSLARLAPGGVAAMVLPTECFTGMSARSVREWLGVEMERLRIDLFAPGSFPAVLQEIAVLSGRRASTRADSPRAFEIVEHDLGGRHRAWRHAPRREERNWTCALLEPHHREAYTLARNLPQVVQLDTVARIEVSTVTGANDFFCVRQATVEQFNLRPWIRPLLARAKHSHGLEFNERDHARVRGENVSAWLLDFDARREDPTASVGPRTYLKSGVERGLPQRYKCRIRRPWYRVPVVPPGSLLLSKRSHAYPRLISNHARALTTDTIYRGDLLTTAAIEPADLVAAFHNSLTLLTVELEGRSFGGGVLELVPSEIARLAVVRSAGLASHLARLDEVARARDPEDLVHETDRLLVASGLLPRDLVEALEEARRTLMDRRLARNSASGTSESWASAA